MGFWIFMFLMCLLIPGIMIAIGSVFKDSSPANINHIYGYRTNMSMKNQDTWEFANLYFGKLALKVGLFTLIPSAIAMLPFLWHSEDAIGIAGSIIMTVQIIPLLAIIPVVENALKKEFDKDGNRRKKP
ncbi:MAG: SdpI family protein [Oscillospiraceae bacterium]|nr:SdpI family protein [Oscillospiraceae bacterium]